MSQRCPAMSQLKANLTHDNKILTECKFTVSTSTDYMCITRTTTEN
jgi:hypothetical protein